MDFRKVTPESITYLRSAGTAEQAKLYIKLTQSHRIAAQNVWFNQQCKHLGVIPSYIRIKSHTNSRAADFALNRARNIWLNEEIKHWFTIRDNYKTHLRVLHMELAYLLHNIEFDLLDDKARGYAAELGHKKYLVQTRKLDRLVRGKQRVDQQRRNTNNLHLPCPHTFYQRVENHSSVQFTNPEVSLLEKGLKYNLQPVLNRNTVQILAVDSEMAIVRGKADEGVKHEVASLIKKPISSPALVPSLPRELKVFKSLKNKIDQNSLVITKADKGNTVVILDRSSYVQKVNEVIQGIDFELLNSDPTKVFTQDLKEITKNSNFISPNSLKYLVPMNPRTPMLYGLPKIHKPNIPIRPVVSYIGAPAYGLSKYLNNALKSRSGFNPKYSLMNSMDLINKIKDVSLPPNAKLLSLDVESLFTNVPYEEGLKILEGHLERQRIIPAEKEELISFTRTCMQQNYFQFGNQCYKQKEGLAMGSPLSPLMADIFMDSFESKNIIGESKILYYYRYVDDIIICWTGSLRQIDLFVNKLNRIHPKIKFKLELETEGSLNFLDWTITRLNNRHDFQIYRKPTYTDITIPNSSCHPLQHKLAAYRSFVHRMMSVPLSRENYNKEIAIIYHIAESNGYSRNMVDGLISRKQRNIVRSLLYPVSLDRIDTYVGSLTYLGPLSEGISRALFKNKVHVAFKTNNLLKQICNGKDRVDNNKKSGVYKLVCDECNGIYVGQTGRSFQVRYKEHLAAYRNNQPEKSNFAQHLLDSGHSLNDNHSFSILHTCDKGFRLSVLENLEITKYSNDTLLNELSTGLPRSPLLRIFSNNNARANTNVNHND